MTDFSQHEEQAVILAWAGDRHGGFIDLGCYDGVTGSNTAALAERAWFGLCIDAAPDAVAACASFYADRPDVDVLAAAFDHLGGGEPATIHWTPAGQYSALEASRRSDVTIAPLLVPRLPLPWLADYAARLPRPLFVSIDLEGESIEALRWVVAYTPASCVCVEANNPADRQAAAEACAGWSPLVVNNWNSIFAREET